jgi:hypothetical protein
MRIVACVLALLMSAAPWSVAQGAKSKPVLYTISLVASGTADGVPFTDEPLQLAGVTDTDTVAALTDAAAEIDPATLQKIISALCAAEGIFLTVVSIILFHEHMQHHNNGRPRLLVTIILDGLQTLPVVRGGDLVTLTIDSVRQNRVEVRFRDLPPGLSR